ncbi:MAG: filamentous hemagglutinin N-terminal domain-containing protein [Rhodocyclaceae bacterium]|nr:filamentous hemagglutinin N-terminal domain-containing protein [Rhodocyclaceae bacterium]
MPTDPTVVNGSATFNQAGNTLTVTNSHGAIINWQQFSIGAGQTTHFQQASSASTVLNRVLGGNVSAIYGTLSSNGQVWLVDPAGIMVGAGGVVDVARLVASTLNVTNADFLANRLNFGGNTATPGTIEIEPGARISTPTGGSVYLVGANVTNEGLITTPKGETILAAGNTVQLVDTTTPGVRVEVSGSEGNATNLGEIAAEAGRIGIAGVIVKNSGVLNASSAVEEGGRIFLRASQDAYVDGNGRIVTTGTQGGSIDVLGQRVAVMDHALLDASAGATGGDGGTVRVGGDYQGKNPDVANARITYFGADATIRANGSQVGAGGTAIVWADDTTRAYGTIEAKGGSVSGDGGFVETSGKRYLDVNGIRGVDVSRTQGQAGTWLLDPDDVNIYAGSGTSSTSAGFSGGVSSYFDAVADNSSVVLYGAQIQTALGLGNVVVSTLAAPFSGGDISVNATAGSYNFTASGNSLSLLAYGGISFASGTNFQTDGPLTLVSGWSGTGTNVVDGRGILSIANSKVYSGGQMTVNVGSTLSLTAGSNRTSLESNAGQTITAGKIEVYGGTVDSAAAVISANGTQVINVKTSGIYLKGFSSGSVYGGYSEIEQRSTSGSQTLNIYGGDVVLRAGDGTGSVLGSGWTGECVTYSVACSGNHAQISNEGSGGQTIAFHGSAQNLTLTASSFGIANDAQIDNESGTQSITGSNLAITLNGGSGGGTAVFSSGAWQNFNNEAGIGSDGAQTVNAGSITLQYGGSGSTIYAGAGLGADGAQNITLSGNLSMVSGGAIPNAHANPELLYLAPVYIGSDVTGTHSLNLTVYGSMTLNGGGWSDVYGGSPALIGNIAGGLNADIKVYGGINLTSATAGAVRIGSKSGSGTVKLQSGLGGTGSMTLSNTYISGATVDLRSEGTGALIDQGPMGVVRGNSLKALTTPGGSINLVGLNRAASVDLKAGGAISYKSNQEFHLVRAENGTATTVDIKSTGGSAYGGKIFIDKAGVAGATTVTVTAYGGIYDDNASGVVNVTGNIVSLYSYGGATGDLAISSDVTASNSIRAEVVSGSTYGGVRVQAVGSMPTTANGITLIDQASFQPSINFYYGGDITSPLALALTSSGPVTVGAGGNFLTANTLPQVGLGASSKVSFSAGSRLQFAGGWGVASRDLSLTAGTLEVANGTVLGNQITASAGTLSMNSSGGMTASAKATTTLSGGATMYGGAFITTANGELKLKAGGDIRLDTGSYLYAGTSAGAINGNLALETAGDLTLNDGSYFKAYDDIRMALTGADSVATLNSTAGVGASYILSDYGTGVAATTYLEFSGRSAGGIVIDGVETNRSSAGGSGFFNVNSSTPAVEGAGLKVTFGVPAASVDAVTNALDDALEAVANDGTSTDGSLPGGSDGDIAGGEDVIRDGEASFGLDEEESEQQAANAQDEKEAEANKNKPVGNCAIGNA